jgi:hypothetical protein
VAEYDADCGCVLTPQLEAWKKEHAGKIQAQKEKKETEKEEEMKG